MFWLLAPSWLHCFEGCGASRSLASRAGHREWTFYYYYFFLHYTRTCPQIKDLSQRKQQVTENLGCKLLAKPITFFFPSKKTQVRVECERNSFGLARKSEQTAWAAPSICTSSSQRSSTNVGFCLYPDDVTYNNIFIFIYLGFLEIKRQYSIIFFAIIREHTYIHPIQLALIWLK